MIRAAIVGLAGLGLCVALAGAQEELDQDLLNELGLEIPDSDDELIVPPQKRSYKQHQTVTLRALDKITGRSTDFAMLVGEPKVYGSLRIDLETCFQTPPEEPPETAAFLKITSATSKQVQTMAEPRDLTAEEMATSESEEADIRFTGWMFASSPGLSALEHPVYDIWVIACSEVVPQVIDPALPIE